MTTQNTTSIDAEIEALKARIRRLRLERKVAALAEAEKKLLQLADQAREDKGDIPDVGLPSHASSNPSRRGKPLTQRPAP